MKLGPAKNVDEAVDKAMTYMRAVLKDQERRRLTDVLVDPRTAEGLLDLDKLDQEIGRGRHEDAAALADLEATLRIELQAFLDEEKRNA